MKINKKYILIIIMNICFSSKNYSQQKDIKLEEEKLCTLYSKMATYRNERYAVDELFSNQLILYVQNNPESLDENFKMLKDSNVCYIETSEDKNFRIYSWDLQYGGTMHFFKMIYQYRYKDKVYTYTPEYEIDNPGEFCSKIYTIEIKDTKYYLPITNAIYSSIDAMQSISAYTIEDGKLNDSVPLFNTRKTGYAGIDVGFDFYSVVNRPERPLQLIIFNEQKKKLYVPEVDNLKQVSNFYKIYKLKKVGFKFKKVRRISFM